MSDIRYQISGKTKAKEKAKIKVQWKVVSRKRKGKTENKD